MDRNITFEIMEQIAVINTCPTGWTKELNVVRWNGGMPKYDIREWDEEHERMSRGVTFTESEMKALVKAMVNRKETLEPKRTMTLITELTVTGEDIDDIMVAALEGGIVYWVEQAIPYNIVGEIEYLGEYASDQISRGGILLLKDGEAGKDYRLTEKNFIKGLRKWCMEDLSRVKMENGNATIDTCTIDSIAADTIIQYAIFGEQIYA